MKFTKLKLLALLFMMLLQFSLNIKFKLKQAFVKGDKKADEKVMAEKLGLDLDSSPPVSSQNFWLQKFYPGKEPILYLEKSWQKPVKKYFILNSKSFYFGLNEKTNAIIEGKYFWVILK